MSKQYNFIDCAYFEKNDKDKNIFNKFETCKLEDAPKHVEFGILDPNINTIEIKDIKKGS